MRRLLALGIVLAVLSGIGILACPPSGTGILACPPGSPGGVLENQEAARQAGMPIPQAPRSVEDVLERLDAAAAGFETVVAELTFTKVTIVVDDRATEKGTVYFKRSRGKRDFKVLIHFREPSEKFVLFRDGKGWIYRPAIAQVEEYDVSRNKEAMEQFLLLGFGTPGRDLQKAYQVALAADSGGAGQQTVKLELLPKSASITRHIRKVELWLSRDNWQPVRQQFTEPSGDYLIAQYAALKLNAPIPDSQFKLQFRGKVKTVRPQSG